MFSSNEIKTRFENGIVVDRHGFELGRFSTMQEDALFLRMAHYHILDGMSCKKVKGRLVEEGISPVEAQAVVDESLAFISDVLEIDLDARIKDQRSTAFTCNRLLRENVSKINAWYDTARNKAIEVAGKLFDADEKSRTALSLALSTSSVPSYWTDASNTRVEEWSTVRARQLLTAITVRDTELHEKMTSMKYAQRIACEKRQLIELQNFKLPE